MNHIVEKFFGLYHPGKVFPLAGKMEVAVGHIINIGMIRDASRIFFMVILFDYTLCSIL